jgi:hypothetical protein
MPTPFTHLVFARAILPALSAAVRAALEPEWPAFLFGNIAPDAQTVSGQAREATHFFPVPLTAAPPAHQVLFERHPALGRPQPLRPAVAAFLSGYLAHLTLDQIWIRQIFDPIFGERQRWKTFGERLYLHNALRAWDDARDLAALPAADISAGLRRAEPEAWLPFLADHDLRAWRDLVADQLGPGGAARTLEVFAARMRADPRAFAALVRSPREMQRRVLARVAPEQLARFRADGLRESIDLIHAYWEGGAAGSG